MCEMKVDTPDRRCRTKAYFEALRRQRLANPPPGNTKVGKKCKRNLDCSSQLCSKGVCVCQVDAHCPNDKVCDHGPNNKNVCFDKALSEYFSKVETARQLWRDPNRFVERTRSNQTIVEDRTTGLTWQGDKLLWIDRLSQAKPFCDTLDHGGYQDWRLPNLEELGHLVNHSERARFPMKQQGAFLTSERVSVLYEEADSWATHVKVRTVKSRRVKHRGRSHGDVTHRSDWSNSGGRLVEKKGYLYVDGGRAFFIDDGHMPGGQTWTRCVRGTRRKGSECYPRFAAQLCHVTNFSDLDNWFRRGKKFKEYNGPPFPK